MVGGWSNLLFAATKFKLNTSKVMFWSIASSILKTNKRLSQLGKLKEAIHGHENHKEENSQSKAARRW